MSVKNDRRVSKLAASPVGFTRSAPEGIALLAAEEGRWAVDGHELVDPIAGADISRLRAFRGVRIQWPRLPVSLDQVIRLAAAGVPILGGPILSGQVPSWAADAAPALAELIADERWLAEETDSTGVSVADLRREEFSVRLRRVGLRHMLRNALRGADPLAGSTSAKVSVILASRRPWMLKGALEQIARQRHVDAEVVLALHGHPAAAVQEAAAGFPLPLTIVEADRKSVFGTVLNEAAARAGGDLLAKWDDDDWYGPEHLADLVTARAYSGADVVGCAPQFYYLEPLDVTIRRTDYPGEVWSDHVAGGTIMLSRVLFDEIGGFGSKARGVDTHLLRAAEAAGSAVYRSHGLGYVLRRSVSTDHTWQMQLAHFLRVATNQWRGFRPSMILESP